MAHANFDNQPQPKTDPEKSSVARSVMGLDDSEKPRAPRFHHISIASAANGATVEHRHPPKPPKKGEHGEAMSTSSEEAKPFVVGEDHPIMKHVNAIHDAISKDCPGCKE